MSVRLPTKSEVTTYISALYRQYQPVMDYIRDGHSRVPVFAEFLKRQAWAAFQIGKSFVWSNKELLVGGATIGAALWMIHQTRKNRAQFPTVRMETSLDVAKITIEAAKGEPLPPCATLVFCMDTSGSMNDKERAGAVKKAIIEVLDNAEQVIQSSPRAQIRIQIVGFDNEARTITPLTQLASSVIEAVKDQVNGIGFDGQTDILAGLELATNDLQASAAGVPTLILLTDGDSNNRLNEGRLGAIHEKLAQLRAKAFVIGIGQGHKTEPLHQIVSENFKGTYIDATAGAGAIESAIAEIYKGAISNYAEVELSAPSLPSGSWSVAGHSPVERCNLGSLASGKALEKVVRIHSAKLPKTWDLASVSFVLTFIDPQGRKGEATLPWAPHSKIVPELIQAGR